MLTLFINLATKLFFLLTPFFVLSVFLSMTEHMDRATQRRVAMRTTLAVAIICMVLYLAGNPIFATLGITLDGFRIGAGSLLFCLPCPWSLENAPARKLRLTWILP